MRINFRHGLISFQQDGGAPQYLQASTTPGFVSHIVAQTPTVVAFAHGGSDYLVKFDDQVDLAWQIMEPVTTYLYWDIDQLTAEVTRGTTIPIPISSISAPPSPVDDQHWFDLSTNLMKVWSASKNDWKVKIRLFAGHVIGGNTNQIVQFSEGSTIGLNVPSNPAYIMLDTMLQPLRKNSLHGEFLTDEDQARVLSTVGTAGVLVQPVSRVVPVRAGEVIPRMSMVYFSADDTVRLADSNPALIPTRPPVGILIDDVTSGEIGTLVQSGEVMYDQWDFTGYAGAPVYCDSFGQITTTRPPGLMAYRVGFIKNPRTVLVLIDAETIPQVYSASSSDLIIAGQTPVSISDVTNGLGERVVTISVPDATAGQRGLLTPAKFTEFTDHGTRLTAAEADIGGLQSSKSNVGHTHGISDVTGLQSVIDGLNTTIDGKISTLAGPAGNFAVLNGSGNLSDSGLNQSTFAAASHTHTLIDVTGAQVAIDQKAFRSHLNAIAEIYTTVNRAGSSDIGSGPTLQSVLDDKAAAVHTHVLADVTDAQTALDGKAPVVHAHAISQVTGLQTELDNRAFISHTHTIGQISNLQSTLDGKASVSHTHDHPAVIFQVGVAPAGGHIHIVIMTSAQATDLIQGTLSTVPVADPSQPSVVISSYPNSNSPNPPHTHDLTVYFDYVNHTFIVTDITNNSGDNHVAFVVGDGAGSGAITLDALTDVSAPSPVQGDVLAFTGGEWQAVQPSASFKPRPLTQVTLTSAYNFGSAAHHNLSYRTGPEGDPDWNKNVLLLHLDTAATDSSPTVKTVALTGSASISTAQKKFGAGAASITYTGGITNNSVRVSAHSDFNLGTQDWTMEFWAYRSTNSGVNYLMRFEIDGGARDFQTYVWENTTNRLWVEWATSVGTVNQQTTYVVPLAQWVHYAYVRNGATLSLYANGNLITSTAIVPSSTVNITSDILFGSNDSGGQNWSGFIDEVRITKGLARYTGNFTPSNAEFYANYVASTVFVTVQPDSFWTGSQEWWENGNAPTTPGPMPTGGSALFGKHDAGNVVFVPGVGVTINTPDTLMINKLHGKATLIKAGPNVWDLEGNLASA